MNYYPFHIGDYSAHTMHLEPMEDLAYRRLLDQYYIREAPLPESIEACAKLVRMRSAMSDVESVLREFFELTNAGWTHKRCDAEIAKMRDKQQKARAAAERSVETRRAFAERQMAEKQAAAERTLKKEQADVELPTPTPTPTPKEIERESSTPSRKPEKPTARASRLPAHWQPSDELLAWARAERPDLDTTKIIAMFSDYWRGKAGKDGCKLDWEATFRNWVRNERAPPIAHAQDLTFRERDAQIAAAKVALYAPSIATKTIATNAILEPLEYAERIDNVKRIKAD